MRPSRLALLASLLFGAAALPVQADEGLFTYVYASETLPKGEKEVALFIKNRSDKGIGSYRATDYTAEFEYGVTDRFTASAYLMAMTHKFKDAFPAGNGVYAESGDSTNFSGVKAAAKYNFMSPYKDAFGFAIVIEPIYLARYRLDGSKTEAYELETRFIFQKNFYDDTWVNVYNFNIEGEYRKFKNGDPDAVENEFRFQHIIGSSYRVIPKWYVGLEGRHTMDIVNGKKNHFAVAMGPNLHYGDKRWYATVTYLRQLRGRPLYQPDFVVPDEVAGDHFNLEENEKNEVQLKIGFNL